MRAETMREWAHAVARTLQAAGHEALFAGGCVRDRLLGRPVSDYDVATAARPEQVEALFEKTVAVGAAFGVIVVVLDGVEIEVATYREDVGIKDGRHPESIRFTDAKSDALRRDFTINGMFEDPDTGEILDFVGGRADLARRVVRAIGDPVARFREDRLRMLRAVRFATVLDFMSTQFSDPVSLQFLLRHEDDQVADPFRGDDLEIFVEIAPVIPPARKKGQSDLARRRPLFVEPVDPESVPPTVCSFDLLRAARCGVQRPLLMQIIGLEKPEGVHRVT